jgi:hypothetical protein
MDVYQRRRLFALSILAGVFVIIVLLIRSCGGDDDETPVATTGDTTATTLTRDEYIEQADATCLESNTSFASVDESDPAVAATQQGQILAGELESLQTLTQPTDGVDDLEDFLSALQDQVAAYDRYVTALDRGDDTAAAELEAEIDDAGTRARKAARQFGFEVCGDTSQVGETTEEGAAASEGGGEGGAATEAPAAPTETVPAAPTETVPAAPVEPAPTTTTPAPPADGGGATPAPDPAPPADDGGTGSGGVSP